MISDANPYETPDENRADLPALSRFESWTNLQLVCLFFVPALTLIVSMIGLVWIQSIIVVVIGFIASVILAVLVSVVTASIHTSRQNSGFASLILVTFIYLLAQTFALFLSLFGFSVIASKFLDRFLH